MATSQPSTQHPQILPQSRIPTELIKVLFFFVIAGLGWTISDGVWPSLLAWSLAHWPRKGYLGTWSPAPLPS